MSTRARFEKLRATLIGGRQLICADLAAAQKKLELQRKNASRDPMLNGEHMQAATQRHIAELTERLAEHDRVAERKLESRYAEVSR